MLSRRAEILVGLGVMGMAVLVLWVLIPGYIRIPRRVPMAALSPAFWPNVIGWTMLICGVLLTARAAIAPPPPDNITDDLRFSRPQMLRVGALGSVLGVSYFALPLVGMVWTCMALYILMVLMSGAKRPIWGTLIAILLPLALYFFFTKVAGVAIPQGRIVRLP